MLDGDGGHSCLANAFFSSTPQNATTRARDPFFEFWRLQEPVSAVAVFERQDLRMDILHESEGVLQNSHTSSRFTLLIGGVLIFWIMCEPQERNNVQILP